MKRSILGGLVAALAVASCAVPAYAGYSSSFSSGRSSFSSSSFSSSRSYSSPSYSSSYSSRSYSAPSYSRPSYTAPASSYRPAPSYNVRSTTVTSSYRPAPAAATTTYRSSSYSAPRTTVYPSHTMVAPVIIHHYGYPGGYYNNGFDAFWHGYFIASMFHQPGYGPMYGAPPGATAGYGAPMVVGNPYAGLDMMLWVIVGLVLFGVIIWLFWMNRREDRA